VSKTKGKQEPEKWYTVERVYLGLDYDPERVNDTRYRDVMPRPEGCYSEYASGKEPPPEGHVDATPHGRAIIERRVVLKPVEVDDQFNILDGFDRHAVARRHGIPCPLVVVKGLGDHQVRDYILEVNSARRDLEPRIRADLVRHFHDQEETAYKAGGLAHRSTYNRIAVLCGVSLRRVRQIERTEFQERWRDACAGERRFAQNGKLHEVRETDPDSQIKGLLGKLAEDAPVDQQVGVIHALREILDRHGDVLAPKDRKEIRD
jgi:hypothetical protein